MRKKKNKKQVTGSLNNASLYWTDKIVYECEIITGRPYLFPLTVLKCSRTSALYSVKLINESQCAFVKHVPFQNEGKAFLSFFLSMYLIFTVSLNDCFVAAALSCESEKDSEQGSTTQKTFPSMTNIIKNITLKKYIM